MATTPNIYIIGSQCTGKTTLVDALSEHFAHNAATAEKKPGIIKELARTVLKNQGFTRADIRNSRDKTLELQRLIVEGQAAAEEAQLRAGAWFISDRSAIDPIIYARKYVGAEEADALCATPHWMAMRDRMAGSLVILCEAGVDWLTDDGVRLMPLDNEEWLRVHAEFCEVLDGAGLEYHVLPSNIGDRDERMKFVLSLWEEKRRILGLGDGEYEQASA